MPIEICGMLIPSMHSGSTTPARLGGSEGQARPGRSIDVDAIDRFARAHEESGFDTALIGSSSAAPDGWLIAQRSAAVTERLRFLVSHRTGFVSPTVAARLAATLDGFCGGRLTIHVLVGGSDEDQRRDGDWIDHDRRYARADEYLRILRELWTRDEPLDFEGEFYRVAGAYSPIKPLQRPHVPLYGGGGSELSVELAARHCDLFMFWGEPLAELRERRRQVGKVAERHGRELRYSVSLRPILGATEAQAWERAHAILASVEKEHAPRRGRGPVMPQSEGSARLRKIAEEGEIYDQRLWTAIARATSAPGNSTALVGTAEQVAESILAYYDLGIETVLIRGFDAYADTLEYGRELIPLLRREVERRDRRRGAGSGSGTLA